MLERVTKENIMKKNYTIKFTIEDEFNHQEIESTTISAKSKEKAISKLEKMYSECSIEEVHSVKKDPIIGLVVLRGQCVHNGHVALVDQMFKECDLVIIGLGSTQEHSTINNPWKPKDRKAMWEKIYGRPGKYSKLKIIELKDIGAVSKISWASYVFGKIEGVNLPKPTHYYAGSKHDANWFDIMNEEFGKDTLHIRILDRFNKSLCMSGTEIRKSILDKQQDWKKYVPEVIVDFVEETFPKELMLYDNIDVEKEKASFEKRKG